MPKGVRKTPDYNKEREVLIKRIETKKAELRKLSDQLKEVDSKIKDSERESFFNFMDEIGMSLEEAGAVLKKSKKAKPPVS
jgi:anion-transporting  ArsA/GET3 family ATPase